MIKKLFFITFRGMGLFLRYIKSNTLSIIALTALFITLHTLFAVGSGVSKFADGVIRFDAIRVYPASSSAKDAESIKAEIEKIDGIYNVKIYAPKDTKTYIEDNAPSVGGITTLPEELFPLFIEAHVTEAHQNTDSLDNFSTQISNIKGVDTVSYGGEWAKRVYKGKIALNSLMFILAVMFIIAGVVMVYQTIHVTLYRYSDEIRVYSIVGGTNTFITLPFVVVAAFIGMLCAGMSYVVYLLIYATFLKPLEGFLGFAPSISGMYCIIFLLAAVAMSKFSGLLSASIFLKKLRNSQESQNAG